MTHSPQSSRSATDARAALALLEPAMTALATLDPTLTVALPRTRDPLAPLSLPDAVTALVATGATLTQPTARDAIATAAERLGAHAVATPDAALYLDPDEDEASSEPAARTRAVSLDTLCTALARYANDLRVGTA